MLHSYNNDQEYGKTTTLTWLWMDSLLKAGFTVISIGLERYDPEKYT